MMMWFAASKRTSAAIIVQSMHANPAWLKSQASITTSTVLANVHQKHAPAYRPAQCEVVGNCSFRARRPDGWSEGQQEPCQASQLLGTGRPCLQGCLHCVGHMRMLQLVLRHHAGFADCVNLHAFVSAPLIRCQ